MPDTIQDAGQSASEQSHTFFKAHAAHGLILGASVFGIFWGLVNALLVKGIKMENLSSIKHVLEEDQKLTGTVYEDIDASTDKISASLADLNEKITTGAKSFLAQEYLYLTIFSAIFAVVLGCTVDYLEISRAAIDAPTNFPYTALAFIIGAATSILAGYIGMRIAVYTNTRTCFQCCTSTHAGFITAFRGGQVLGFTLVGLALLVLHLILVTFKATWFNGQLELLMASSDFIAAKDDLSKLSPEGKQKLMDLVRRLFELVAGYGLGASTVALFGRVGGGIYTKAADVGADLVGKVYKDLEEDDPSNPGTIADNVGDNVGDIAGMGADLFGSLAESTCAALVVSSTSYELIITTDALYFPLMITAAGLVASFFSVLLVHVFTVTEDNVQNVLKSQLAISTSFMTVALIPLVYVLPATFSFHSGFEYLEANDGSITRSVKTLDVTAWVAYGCICFGLWSGMVIGFTTEYFTSNVYAPTLALAEACNNGPAPNIILGLALGYNSCIIPILCITATIGYAFTNAGMYGIALAALGMLGSLPVALTIDGYGPISDNAGGIAAMSGLPTSVRDQTDALDAAGNTTAAVGKGFAIGSACLVGLALFGAFNTRVGETSVDILKPVAFCGLLVGAMLPYAFSALTMAAVGDAANEMMNFILADFNKRDQCIKDGTEWLPDYQGCIKISTDASLAKMVAPGALVLGSPLLAGFLLGTDAVAGLLAGAIVSGVQVAISASNTGGAWDNAKKQVEKERSTFMREVNRLSIDLDAARAENEGVDFQNEKAWKQKISDDASRGSYEPLDWACEFVNLKERKNAAVVGDTVGDPLKDTSGPAINILIKLSAITSLVFGSYISDYNLIKLLKAKAATK